MQPTSAVSPWGQHGSGVQLACQVWQNRGILVTCRNLIDHGSHPPQWYSTNINIDTTRKIINVFTNYLARCIDWNSNHRILPKPFWTKKHSHDIFCPGRLILVRDSFFNQHSCHIGWKGGSRLVFFYFDNNFCYYCCGLICTIHGLKMIKDFTNRNILRISWSSRTPAYCRVSRSVISWYAYVHVWTCNCDWNTLHVSKTLYWRKYVLHL